MDPAPEPEAVVYRDVIAVGASAGGIGPLTELIGALPADFPAALLVVVHLLPGGSSMLSAILNRAGPLEATSARDGEPIGPGRAYVAPPDRHLLMRDGAVRLTRDPAEKGHRPAIDPLFRSVADDAGPRAIGIVLSGALDDGAAGLAVLKLHGGLAVVQEPGDALYPSMPRNACSATEVDRVVPARDLADVLAELVGTPTEPPAAVI